MAQVQQLITTFLTAVGLASCLSSSIGRKIAERCGLRREESEFASSVQSTSVASAQVNRDDKKLNSQIVADWTMALFHFFFLIFAGATFFASNWIGSRNCQQVVIFASIGNSGTKLCQFFFYWFRLRETFDVEYDSLKNHAQTLQFTLFLIFVWVINNTAVVLFIVARSNLRSTTQAVCDPIGINEGKLSAPLVWAGTNLFICENGIMLLISYNYVTRLLKLNLTQNIHLIPKDFDQITLGARMALLAAVSTGMNVAVVLLLNGGHDFASLYLFPYVDMVVQMLIMNVLSSEVFHHTFLVNKLWLQNHDDVGQLVEASAPAQLEPHTD